MQILKNLYQIGGSLNGLTWTGSYRNYEDANSYLIKGDGGCILIDCGNGETWPKIASNMSYWGIKPEDIKACLLTHAHMDHTGAAYILAKMGVPLYAHKKTAASLAAADERCASFLYHKQAMPCRVENTFEGGETLNICGTEINALHFPGHTAGCTAYLFELEGKTVAACGDVIGTLMDGHFGWDGSIDFDRTAYLSSLLKFASIDMDIMLSGHGLIYYGSPRHRVEEALCVALSEWRK